MKWSMSVALLIVFSCNVGLAEQTEKKNLIDDPTQQERIEQFRAALHHEMATTRDPELALYEKSVLSEEKKGSFFGD